MTKHTLNQQVSTQDAAERLRNAMISVKGLSPYWDEFCAENSAKLWLPTEITLPVSDLSVSNGLSTHAAVQSWFAIKLYENPNRNLPKIYSASFMRSLADTTDLELTRAKKIKFWPNKAQQKKLNNWLGITGSFTTRRYGY